MNGSIRFFWRREPHWWEASPQLPQDIPITAKEIKQRAPRRPFLFDD